MNKRRFYAGLVMLITGLVMATGVVMESTGRSDFLGTAGKFVLGELIFLALALLILGLVLCVSQLAKSVVKRLKESRERNKVI